MSAFSSTYGSTAIGDTGLDYMPKGIPLNGNGIWHEPPNRHPNRTMDMTNEPPAGPGHNSKVRRSSWYTPSKQSFQEAAQANAGAGRNVHRLRVIQAAVFDSRLGVCPIPVKLLVAVMGYGNRETGAAHPGARTLAEEIYQDLQKLPLEERAAALDKAAGVIMNMFTLLKQCGYDVSIRRAPADGGHAVAHHALTYPDREEMLAAIPIHQQWQEQETARKADAKKKVSPNEARQVSSPNEAREVSSPNDTHEVTDLTRRMRSEGADLTRTTVSDLTRRQENSEPHSITEPKKEPGGADAPDASAPADGETNPKVGTRSSPKRATPAAALPADAAAAFERFWDVFPPGRKRDKAGTRDLFLAIVTGRHKKRRAPAEVIVAAAARYAATRPDPQYTPMPSTWLNGGRWEDDECQPQRQIVTDEEAELVATLERMRAEKGWS